MNRGRGIVLGPKMRILHKGLVYNLISMSAIFEFDEQEMRLKVIQTFLVSKQEPATLEDADTIYEVLATEIIPLAGNDYAETSPFVRGIEHFLEKGNNNEPY